MPNIKVLPEQLINQIAAGEVVERPASVVKELIENSIDAGAKRIVIEVGDGGQSLIRITDDGHGMGTEDAKLSLERHATSKIFSAEDLTNIRSLGFRGEAIASIASVSKFHIQTKKKGDTEGTVVNTEGGKVVRIKAIGCPEGTQVEVLDLFYNTPARKKYLKTIGTEYRHILNVVTGIALAFPAISFRLIKDGALAFELAPTDDDLVRVRGLLGKNISDELVPVFYGHTSIGIKGYIGKPAIARSNRNNQYLFVNNREVKSHLLSFAVKQSFHSLLPKEKHPTFILFLDIDPRFVDVNVHPRKLEVRFSNDKEIFSAVMQSCKKALEKHVLTTDIRGHQTPITLRQPDPVSGLQTQMISVSRGTGGSSEIRVEGPGTVEEAMQFTESMTQKLDESYTNSVPFIERQDLAEILPLAQLANSYILCQQGDSLVIVDQHAAHERIRYTEILEEFEKKKKTIQPLLAPLNIELSHKEVAVFNENKEIFEGMGFEIEEFGGNTFSIFAVPSYIVKEDLQAVILGLIDDLLNSASKGDFQARKERSLTYMACRSAVKFGDPLSKEEQESLLERLQKLDLPYTCPHGRPTMTNIALDELARRFGRK